MQIKNLDRAVEIRDRIKTIDREIDVLMDFMPITKKMRDAGNLGILFKRVKLYRKDEDDIIMRDGYKEIALSNEDVRTLMDNRFREKEQLGEELKQL